MIKQDIIKKIQEFFHGRYGLDQWSRLGIILGLILNLFGFFLKKSILSSVSLVFLLYFGVFRVFSKNLGQRQMELKRFLQGTKAFSQKVSDVRRKIHTKRTKKEITCPHCQAKCRIPRGKGTVKITCPHCQKKFISKS